MQGILKQMRCLFCLVLAIALLVTSGSVVSLAAKGEETEGAEAAEGYTLVAESDSIAMYAEMEEGHFYLENKKSGDKWYSVPQGLDEDEITKRKEKVAYKSELIVDYVIHEGFASGGLVYNSNSNAECAISGEINIKTIKNGMRVEYVFSGLGFTIPVEYTISGDTFNAKIDTKNIKEGKDCGLIRIYLLPTFGAAGAEEQGYLFIPDGSGVLANFNNGVASNVYKANVYGTETSNKKETSYSNTENIRMPVFGMSKGTSGYVAYVEKGDAAASVRAVVGNASNAWNFVHSVLEYAFICEDELVTHSTSTSNALFRIAEQKYSLPEFSVNYELLAGESVSYVDMAEVYRDFLVNEKGLEKIKANDMISLNVYGAVETQANFLGIKYKKLKKLTSYEDVEVIIKALEEKGIAPEDLGVRYIGWQNDGIFNKGQLKNSKILGVLGGKKDFNDLQKYLKENDVSAAFDADLVLTRSGSINKVATTAFNKKAWQYQYLRSVYVSKLTVDPWTMVNEATLKKNSASYLKSLSKSIENVGLSTLTNTLYSDFHQNKGSYRTEMAETAAEVLENYSKKYNVIGDSANAYALPYVTKIYNTPTKNSAYKMFDKEVPFYQIVLKGYIPMTGGVVQAEINTDTELLKAVETGTGLLFNCIYEDATLVRGLREEDL
ncbi:MAG: hypothetical protein IJN15_02690, partial [Clostridia bacterium]|nr:hypothetical protein [Clostridia bacterium]